MEWEIVTEQSFGLTFSGQPPLKDVLSSAICNHSQKKACVANMREWVGVHPHWPSSFQRSFHEQKFQMVQAFLQCIHSGGDCLDRLAQWPTRNGKFSVRLFASLLSPIISVPLWLRRFDSPYTL